jgi:hypothetical protein
MGPIGFQPIGLGNANRRMTSTVSGLAEKNEGRARDERAFLFSGSAYGLGLFYERDWQQQIRHLPRLRCHCESRRAEGEPLGHRGYV